MPEILVAEASRVLLGHFVISNMQLVNLQHGPCLYYVTTTTDLPDTGIRVRFLFSALQGFELLSP